MVLIEALWFAIPAYAANSFPVIVRGKRPIDFGTYFRGNRLLGDGKTIEGTAAGMFFGLFLGALQVIYQHLIPAEWGLSLIEMTFPIVALLVAGTLAGDIAASFFKRRIGLKRGEKAILLDQLDFMIGALLFTSIVFVPDATTIIVLLIVTPLIHWLSNIFGYVIRVKQNPW